MIIGLEMNFDKESFKGESIAVSRIYKSMEQHKHVSIVMDEFYRNSDQLSKIRYLQTKGIQSPVSDADFDLTLLKTIKTLPQKPKAKEVEEEIADEEEISDEPLGIFLLFQLFLVFFYLGEKEEIVPEEEENTKKKKK